MTNTEYGGTRSNSDEDKFLSTSYSNNISCGACGAALRRVPVMYEHMSIDWRCGRCLRRDKPASEDQA